MKKNSLVWIAFLSFAGLGIFDGMLGVAWPSMRGDFAVSLDALGSLLLPAVAAYTLASSYSGWLLQRLGQGRLLALGAALRTVAIAGQALSPVWWGMIAAGMLNGLGGGGLDAGINTYVATRQNARTMNWLHAFYGVGATLGPLVATRILVAGLSWRWSYAVAAGFQLFLLALFLNTRKAWDEHEVEDDDAAEERTASFAATLKLPAVWLGVLIFFVYTGTEVSTGQWSFTLFTEGRGIDLKTAGFWVGAFWGCFTVGRFIIGAVAERLRPETLLRLALAGTATGLALLWWDPSQQASFLGLALAGFAMAPIFPTMLTETPLRLGKKHAANAIGLQVAAAGLGVGVLVGGVGALAERYGLESIGAVLLGAALLLWAMYELWGVVSVRRKPAA